MGLWVAMTEINVNQLAENNERTAPPLGAGASAAPQAQSAPDKTTAPDKTSASDKSSTAPSKGKNEAEGAPESGESRLGRGRFAFMRSLQFRLMVIFVVVGMILTAIMSVMSYNRMVRSAQQFVDEELSQISSVAINYNMIIPRRWEAPRRNHERVLRLRQRNGSIVLEYSTVPSPEGRPGMGPGRGQGMGRDQHAQESLTPSIVDLYKFKYDIIIAPLYGRPGDALYIPPGVPDGFYTVIVADERVRAFVATNTVGQRFVVARPLDVVNDISAMTFDPEMASVVSGAHAAVILMHMRGTPQTMQNPEHLRYSDVCAEVADCLNHAFERAVAAGISPDSILLDPGLGFAKTPEQNLALVRGAAELRKKVGAPLYYAPSRKSFLARVCAGKPASERDYATAGVLASLAAQGIEFVRVHNVPMALESMTAFRLCRPDPVAG